MSRPTIVWRVALGVVLILIGAMDLQHGQSLGYGLIAIGAISVVFGAFKLARGSTVRPPG